MRRILLTSLLAASLMGSFGGCHHLAGVCDCDHDGWAAHPAPLAAEPPVAAVSAAPGTGPSVVATTAGH